MSTAELNDTRKELISWINSLKDNALLGLLNSVKLSSEGKETDWWNKLTEIDKDNISLGLKDFEAGRTLNSKEFWNNLNNE